MQITYSVIYIKKSFFRFLLKGWIGMGIIFLLFSCNTGDFDLQKLSTSNLKPKIYVPLAYGTFDIKNYLPSVISGSDDQIINIAEVYLNPLTWRKGEFSLQPNAMDQVSMEITITNSSPMKARFEIFTTDYFSGTPYGRSYSGEIDPAESTTQPSVKKFVYTLTYDDLTVIKNTDGLKCKVTLMQPDSGSGITIGSVKSSQFRIQLNLSSGLVPGKLN